MKFNFNDDHFKKFHYWGKFFGYPDCCIEEFIGFCKGVNKRSGDRKFNGTGYVPCSECDKKTEKELLQYIKLNRKTSIPFPRG